MDSIRWVICFSFDQTIRLRSLDFVSLRKPENKEIAPTTFDLIRPRIEHIEQLAFVLTRKIIHKKPNEERNKITASFVLSFFCGRQKAPLHKLFTQSITAFLLHFVANYPVFLFNLWNLRMNRMQRRQIARITMKIHLQPNLTVNNCGQKQNTSTWSYSKAFDDIMFEGIICTALQVEKTTCME